MSEQEKAFIRVAGREMAVGDVEFSFSPYVPNERDEPDPEVMGGMSPHSLTVWVEPTDDQSGYFGATDMDLFVEGAVPEALDGLRIDQDLETGDAGTFPMPWIRPGSLTGMSLVGFDPASKRDENNGYDDDERYLQGRLRLSLDRIDDLWRIEIETGYEPEGDLFHAVFFAPLSIWTHAE